MMLTSLVGSELVGCGRTYLCVAHDLALSMPGGSELVHGGSDTLTHRLIVWASVALWFGGLRAVKHGISSESCDRDKYQYRLQNEYFNHFLDHPIGSKAVAVVSRGMD